MPSKVLINGAGPTGLVLAISLAELGVSFRIIDKKKGPGEASRAIVVHARTLEFYQQLGLAEEIIEKGTILDQVQIYKDGKFKATLKLDETGKGLSRFPFILSLPQDEHEQILVRKLHTLGHCVEWETELKAFHQQTDAVYAVVSRDGSEEESDYAYLCGCDGIRSTVRKGLGLDFSGGTYQQIFYVADVRSGSPVNSIQINLFKKGFAIALPIRTTGSLRLIGLLPKNLLEKEKIEFAELARYIESNTQLHIEKKNWFSTYKVHHRVSEHFREGRVFIAGDAAHVHSPAGGQGMNTGIGDAINLSWKLAAVIHGKAGPAILDTFETERMAFARTLVSTTDKIFEMIAGEGLSTKVMKEMLLPYIAPKMSNFRVVKQALFKTVSQIRIHYRDSALSEGAAGSLHSGDRLPWVPIGEEDNYKTLQTMDWQFQVYGHASPSIKDFSQKHAIPLHQFPWTETAEKAGFLRDAVFLIRPDGHIAVADNEKNLDMFETYLVRLRSR